MNQALRTGLIVVAAIVAIGLYASVFVVGQMQQALVLQFGRVRAVLNPTGEEKPGLYFKVPFAETVVTFDKRVLDLDLRSRRSSPPTGRTWKSTPSPATGSSIRCASTSRWAISAWPTNACRASPIRASAACLPARPAMPS